MFHFTKKRAVVLAVVGSLAVSAGAYAYFTSTGTGTGTATVGTSSAFVIAANAPSGGPLTPGGPVDTVAYRVTNPSSGQQRLNRVRVSVANADGSEWTARSGCSAADFIIGEAAAGITYEDTEHAGDISPGFVDNTVTITMVNAARDQDGCKGAVPPLYLAAS